MNPQIKSVTGESKAEGSTCASMSLKNCQHVTNQTGQVFESNY